MADRRNSDPNIERIDGLSIVSLKVSAKSSEEAADRLQLASPLHATGDDPRSLWLGPDLWLLVSDSKSPDALVRNCQEKLAGLLHSAVDYSAGLAVLRMSGPDARRLLAAGSGIDLRPDKFRAGSCARTRLAQVAAVVVAEDPEQFDVYVDRSYGTYLTDWLDEASEIYQPVS